MDFKLTNRRMERPVIKLNDYGDFQDYRVRKADEDKLAILVCQIKIWFPKGNDWFNIPKESSGQCLVLRECESIEIDDSAKELINKAVVKFPRGTVIQKSSHKEKQVVVGDINDRTDRKEELKKATNDGELITQKGTVYENDEKTSITSSAPNYDSKGLIDYQRNVKELALLSPNDVAVGNRIEIRLGYAYSDKEYNEMNRTDHDGTTALDMVFTGFITAISTNSPLQIECTNMAHILTTISTPNIHENKTITVKDFLDDDGKYHLLKDTGITLAKSSRKSDISVSGGAITNNLTVADVLAEWNGAGVMCIMDTKRDGSAELKVGMLFYAGKDTGLPTNDKKYITYTGDNHSVLLIQSDWDVASDNLEMKMADKKYLAVEAQGRTKDNKFFKLTIRKLPNSEDKGWANSSGGQFQIVNRRMPKKKKEMKFGQGTNSANKTGGHLTNKINLDKYTVIPYISTKRSVDENELIEEAKQFWAKYDANGISGSVTIFGDLFVKPASIVGLIDMRFPEKNGYYYVESVHTTFGLNGYRRELKIPYKIASIKKVNIVNTL